MRGLKKAKHTLWLCEVTLLYAGTKCLVELSVKDCGGSSGGLVVGLDVLLDGWTAVE